MIAAVLERYVADFITFNAFIHFIVLIIYDLSSTYGALFLPSGKSQLSKRF